MNLYTCKVGDVVLTGDSYGMSPCVCIEESHMDYNLNCDVVTFLDLCNGSVHEAGCSPGFEYLLDECRKISYRLSEKEVKRLKKVWNV